jgi:hypothetical protein
LSKGVWSTLCPRGRQAYSRFVSKKVLLCHAPEKPCILAPSAGYIFAWKGYFGALRFGPGSRSSGWRTWSRDRIEEEMTFDAKQIAAGLGIYAANVIA